VIQYSHTQRSLLQSVAMSLEFILWLFAFLMHAALLGRILYALTSLADLESDFINPFELSKRLNGYVAAEYGAQLALTLLFVATGKWFVAVLEAGILAYMVRIWRKGQAFVDAPDAFKQVPVQKPIKLRLCIAQVACFVVIVYRLVGCAIHSLLTPAGRHAAHKLFREAASSIHGY
jgi:protein cornichon